MKKMNSIVTRQSGWVKSILLFCLFTILPSTASAQCGIENIAFKSGEELAYDLYFNWKFIWMKVGTAEMDTKMVKYEGKDAWKSYLITRGNEKIEGRLEVISHYPWQ